MPHLIVTCPLQGMAEGVAHGIADELSRQYYLGYSAPNGHDGRWHDIRVEVDNDSYVVRARRGYVAGGGI